MTDHDSVFLEPVSSDDLPSFCKLMESAFAASEPSQSFEETPSGVQSQEPAPAEGTREVRASYGKPHVHTVWVVYEGARVGGAVVETNAESHRSMLVWFFIAPQEHGRGIGTRAWQAIEQQWPDTRVWELGTPYCDKRNVHFYINKCGFHAVEFYNRHHPDPWRGEGDARIPEESFRFEKVMDTTRC